ncbi:hypothetical protein MCEMSEM47_01234 [Burkholderiales bacterium]
MTQTVQLLIAMALIVKDDHHMCEFLTNINTLKGVQRLTED